MAMLNYRTGTPVVGKSFHFVPFFSFLSCIPKKWIETTITAVLTIIVSLMFMLPSLAHQPPNWMVLV